MGMKTVAIIGALDEEVALIAKSLTHVTHTAKGSLDIVSGTVDSSVLTSSRLPQR